MSKFLSEFKEFAVKGNALDMAVGVIVGAAFGKIVSSIVDDIIMPPIGWLIGGMDFSNLKITLPAEKIVEGVARYVHPERHRLRHRCFLRVPARQRHQQAGKKEGRDACCSPSPFKRREAAHGNP